MILTKNGKTQELTNQIMIDAFLNNGWEPAAEPAPVQKEEPKEAPVVKKAAPRKK